MFFRQQIGPWLRLCPNKQMSFPTDLTDENSYLSPLIPLSIKWRGGNRKSRTPFSCVLGKQSCDTGLKSWVGLSKDGTTEKAIFPAR